MVLILIQQLIEQLGMSLQRQLKRGTIMKVKVPVTTIVTNEKMFMNTTSTNFQDQFRDQIQTQI